MKVSKNWFGRVGHSLSWDLKPGKWLWRRRELFWNFDSWASWAIGFHGVRFRGVARQEDPLAQWRGWGLAFQIGPIVVGYRSYHSAGTAVDIQKLKGWEQNYYRV